MFSRFRTLYTALLLTSWLIVVSCTGATAQETLMPGAKTVPAVFQPVIAQLQAQTQVPIVLPTQIPTHVAKTYAYVSDSSKDAYELTLDVTADCRGKDYCLFGILNAQAVYQDTPSVQSIYAFELDPNFHTMARSPEQQGEVQLSHGITGYFVPYVCGFNCDTSKVFWEQSGYRYSVQIRMASQAAVVRMANSAIENEP